MCHQSYAHYTPKFPSVITPHCVRVCCVCGDAVPILTLMGRRGLPPRLQASVCQTTYSLPCVLPQASTDGISPHLLAAKTPRMAHDTEYVRTRDYNIHLLLLRVGSRGYIEGIVAVSPRLVSPRLAFICKAIKTVSPRFACNPKAIVLLFPRVAVPGIASV